jgi:outer membrane lipoprotein SlyB
MTVLGAIGGGVAGHEVEKYARRERVYEVRVRMDDGSVRTFQQKTAPAAGARVTVEGHTLHVVRAAANGSAGA